MQVRSRRVFTAIMHGRLLERKMPVKALTNVIDPMILGRNIGMMKGVDASRRMLPLTPHTHTLTDKGWTPCQGCEEERAFNYIMRDGD